MKCAQNHPLPLMPTDWHQEMSADSPSGTFLNLLARSLALLWATLPALSRTTWTPASWWQSEQDCSRSDSHYPPLFSSVFCVESATSDALHVSWHPQSMQYLLMVLGYSNASVAGSSTTLMLFQSLWTEKNHKHKRIMMFSVHSCMTLAPAETRGLERCGADVTPEGPGPKQMNWDNLRRLASEPGIRPTFI